jgi:endonuclease I
MLRLLLWLRLFFSAFIRPAQPQETVKDRLRRLYKNHTVWSYSDARTHMYNAVDCASNQIRLLYGGNYYSWTCGGTTKPDANEVNAEHIVPQSLFDSKTPMVSDLNHLYSSPSKLNNVRSNYKFAEVSYDQCAQWCTGFTCSTTRPSNPDNYSCLSTAKTWMPRTSDRGIVARAVLYFFTMYDGIDISAVGSVETFKKWNRVYAPAAWELARNERLNKTQKNRNPYIDDPSLADQVF